MQTPSVSLTFEIANLEEHVKQVLEDNPLLHLEGLPEIDDLIGGIRRGLVTVIGAQPGCGKTTLVGQMADDVAAQGHPVIFISAELPSFRIAEKSILRLAGSTLPDDKNAKGWPEAFHAAARSYGARIAPNTCIVDNLVNMAQLTQLVSDCQHARKKTPIVFVDYLQLIATSEMSASGDERIAIANCVRELSNIAKTYESPVFAVSTISRQSYGKRDVGLDVFGGSQNIEYGIDNALYLTIEGANRSDVQANSEKAVRPVVVRALKVRYGSISTAYLDFDAAHAAFRTHAS